jgi:hypothetical protein
MQSATGRPGVGITVTRRWAARRAAQLALDLQLTARIVLIFAQQRAAMLDRKIRTGTAVVTVIAAWRIAIIARWRRTAIESGIVTAVLLFFLAARVTTRRRAVNVSRWRTPIGM